MPDHPYASMHNKAFWRRSVTDVALDAVDPVGRFALRIGSATKIATAGSCFAQHIARHLLKHGFNYFVSEPGHPILPADVRERHNYGQFSARYGNVYTARQLLQLMRRAYGRFSPSEDAWTDVTGAVRDPFRPTIEPDGFNSIAEMQADRSQHLAAVRSMFEQLDVFVFTLGLTECWESRSDGAVFPLCPGVSGGAFEPTKYAFRNQEVTEVVDDMSQFMDELKVINPAAEVVLTVSPVPLAATAEPDAHVLSATTYSKASLRVAAEILRKRYGHVHYFPSYEIITGAFNRGRYFAPDLRNVTEDGVSHVMRLFLRHAAGDATIAAEPTIDQARARNDDFVARATELVEVECDEAALDSKI